ncbi:D-ribose pyranase [Chitinivorax tropicus]|uniref:D-ribose pyranase n=1 Tax=Chitinivorax tropicus TaxID=714531 RepID=A0A840MNM2_9PROT|nr:D-ribose pyranase [Chitinivorax tropicus]MBB5018689.1 D-ribose pyranase [Chitinivorax tropicus]
MKKTPLLHPDLSDAIARLGHGDMLVIADAGLPIPDGPRRIDLAVTPGLPGLDAVLEVVLGEMQAEYATIASELGDRNPVVAQQVAQRLGGLAIRQLDHEQFKQLTRAARVIVRTGECTPYANVILHAGVVF